MRRTHSRPPTTSIPELAANVSESFDLFKTHSKAILEGLRDEIVQNLIAGNRVNLFGLGILEPRTRKERMGHNPKTGEPLTVSAHRRIIFRASKTLKEQF